ncbi:MAG: hypothetical protein IJ080_04005 [Oscillospiraceae bacterium]|nr:hypothetical protein [Oscillospiraceae bacterium]MBQ8978912.1 hypothetical protein [Oscillospiraceae bacterium]
MKLLAERNRRINKDIPLPDGFICGQGQGNVSDMHFGLYRMSYNGCGAIALYNALRLCGQERDLREIALLLEPQLVLLGTFGVYPGGMGRALSSVGIPFRRLKTYGDLLEGLSRYRVFILCYWTKKPWLSSSHFVAVERVQGGYEIYNLFNNVPVPVKIPDLTGLCSRKQFIRCYALE